MINWTHYSNHETGYNWATGRCPVGTYRVSPSVDTLAWTATLTTAGAHAIVGEAASKEEAITMCEQWHALMTARVGAQVSQV